MKDAIVIPISALRRIFVMLLVLIALILVVLVVRTQLFRAGVASLFAPSAAEAIDRGLYQAVFLTNGSTYFGKLQEQGDQWFLLSDAFYLAGGWAFPLPALGRAQYQGVFLAKGQPYFGRYYARLGAYAKIEAVYYLQQTQTSDPTAAPDTKIVRRGRELHGPTSRMLVPKSAVLFIEDLTDSSPIAGFMRQDGP